jgi:hypothetical protein
MNGIISNVPQIKWSPCDCLGNHDDSIVHIEQPAECNICATPAEDVELAALRNYILSNGFNEAGVAFHIIHICATPLVSPSTATWDFVDRADVPRLILTTLKSPGYLEGIWPSLKIIMGSNSGNSAWTAGIATTIAFFDVIKILPILKGN